MFVENHILTKNLKALVLWILSLLKCSTINFLNNVELITHTSYTIVNPLSVSPSIYLCSPINRNSFVDIHMHLYHRCCCSREPNAWAFLVWKTFVTKSRSNPCRNTTMILLFHNESSWNHPHLTKRNHTNELNTAL